ncbi:MAG TPA: GNAT family protein [Candidatus Cloacimonas sp.]|jgi:RimJ/RimL family protein N-acetyltransferase|nr:GNAT family protein [Candidatus Cloacimonas sp.]
MKYYRKLLGEKCYLSPVCMDDVEKYTEWLNDMEIGQFVTLSDTVLDIDKEGVLLRKLMDEEHIFAIVEKDTNKVIGNCGIHNVSQVHRNASLGIFIGEKTFWNQGIGAEAINLLLDFAFNILNLHNIYLSVMSYNKRAIRCYEKIGFKKIGVQREFMFVSGKYHDVYLYDMLASEFTSPYIKKVFAYSISDEAGRSKISIV